MAKRNIMKLEKDLVQAVEFLNNIYKENNAEIKNPEIAIRLEEMITDLKEEVYKVARNRAGYSLKKKVI